MSSNELSRAGYTVNCQEIDRLASFIRGVLYAAQSRQPVSDEDLDAALSALRRIVEQAKECA